MGNLITGVDIGASQLKIVTLRQRKQGWGVVAAHAEDVSDLDRASPDYGAELAARLRAAVKKNSLPIGDVIVAAPGRGGMLRYLSMPVMPPWRLELAMKYETDEQLSNLNQSPEAIASDYAILEIPDFDPDQFPVILALSQKDAVNERLLAAKAALRKMPLDVDLNVFGAFNAFRHSPQCLDDEVSVLLDVGTDEIQLTLQQGAQLLFARTVPGGGARQTVAIATALQILPQQAEAVKRARAEVIAEDDQGWHDEEARQLSQCLQKEIANMAQGVQSAVAYFGREFKVSLRPTKIYYTGGGALLPGLLNELGRRARLPVEPFVLGNVFAFFAKPALEERLFALDSGCFSVAAGLALSRALPGGVKVTLLPQEEKDKRRFWREKIFVYYAGVAAALILAVLIFHSWKLSSHASQRNALWKDKLSAAKGEHERFKKLEEENLRAATTLRDLLTREDSGNFVASCLHSIRECTPEEDIFYVDMAFGPSDPTTIGARRDAAAPPDAAATLQATPVLRLSGYLTKQKDYQSAQLKLEQHIKNLKAKVPQFADVTPMVMEMVQDKPAARATRRAPAKGAGGKDDEDALQPDFNERQRFNSMYDVHLTADSADGAPTFAPGRGSALFFVVNCQLKP